MPRMRGALIAASASRMTRPVSPGSNASAMRAGSSRGASTRRRTTSHSPAAVIASLTMYLFKDDFAWWMPGVSR